MAQPFTGHQDNVNVDFQADASSPSGQVKVLIDFRNPLIVGKFVYHCHILEHEDGGMMAVAEVQPSALPGSASRAAPAWWARSGSAVERWLAAFGSGAEAEAQARREAALAEAQAASLCRTDTPPAALEAAESAVPGQPASKAPAPVSARNISLVSLRPEEPMR